MIPVRYSPLLFSLILSGLMSLMVAGISTFRLTGPVPHFITLWLSAWVVAWLFAFPAVVLVTPIARKAVQFLTTKA